MEIEPLKIRKNGVNRLTGEERLALARIAEVISKWNLTFTELGWINQKHRVKVRLPGDPDTYAVRRMAQQVRAARRFALFESMTWAYGTNRFERWFSDVIAPQARTPEAREETLRGAGEWAAVRKALHVLGYELAMGRNLFDDETLVTPASYWWPGAYGGKG